MGISPIVNEALAGRYESAVEKDQFPVSVALLLVLEAAVRILIRSIISIYSGAAPVVVSPTTA